MRRILRDYQDAGSVNSLLALWGFVDDDTFLTKAGDVGLVYRVAGADYECLDQTQRRDIVHRFEAAVRPLDDACRVYQYLCTRRIDLIVAARCRQPLAHEAIQRRTAYLNARREELYDLDLYVVLLYEGLRSPDTSSRLRGLWGDPRAALRQSLSSR